MEFLENIQDNAMENIPDLYVIGLPIITDIGVLYPLQVIDYPKFVPFVQILNMEDFEFKDMIKANLKENIEEELKLELEPEMLDLIFDEIEDLHFFYLITEQKNDENSNNGFYSIYNHYKKLFKICFHEDIFDLIKTHEEFEYYRNLIRDFNGIEYDKPNPNPEIRKFDNYKKLLAARKGDMITFSSMYTSVLVATGMNPNNLTLYQFHKVFDRIAHFKNFDITTMYKMLDGELEIDNWYSETKKEEDTVITEEQLKGAIEAQEQGKQGLQNDL